MAERLREERRRFIQRLLQLCLSVASFLMGLGLLVVTIDGSVVARSASPADLVSSLDTGDRLMLAGITLLAVTPALRVVALMTLWIRERAWRFVATSAAVLVLLIAALLIGGR